MEITTIGVIGAGQMGAGIAHVAALSGYNVILTDISEDRLSAGISGISDNMNRAIGRLGRKLSKGQISQDDHDIQVEKMKSQIEDALGRISTSIDLAAHASAQLVVEAATENINLKYKIFEELSAKTPNTTILCSNTSSISITAIGSHTNRPDKVMGMHFMNPVPVMKLVELIRGLATSDETYAMVNAVAEKMGKTTVEGRDMPGFIVNRVLMPYINEAVQALYEGIASVEDIDTAMKLGTNVPMGPLTLADFIGLDTCLAIMEVLHEGMGDSKYRPCPLLRKYVEAGWLGKKTGKGFYLFDERGKVIGVNS
jgi:3-hydroxybutyryl-CoA dehydrogenase